MKFIMLLKLLDNHKAMFVMFQISTNWFLEPNTFEKGFPGGSAVRNPPANAGDADLIPGSERSPGAGNGNPLQYSCLENPMDRGAWWATVHGVPNESNMT